MNRGLYSPCLSSDNGKHQIASGVIMRQVRETCDECGISPKIKSDVLVCMRCHMMICEDCTKKLAKLEKMILSMKGRYL